MSTEYLCISCLSSPTFATKLTNIKLFIKFEGIFIPAQITWQENGLDIN